MKKFLFSLMAIFLAGLGLGGVSMADNVAQIGNTPYTSLGAAFDAAGDGATITLLSDLTRSSSTINITDKTLTLDLDGHVINTSIEPLFKVNGGSLTVTGTSATEGGVNSTVGGIFYVFGGNLVINGGIFTGKSTLYVHGETARATVNDGYFVGQENGNTTSIGVNRGGELVINSGTFIAGVNDSGKPQKVIYAGDDYNKCGKADPNYEIRGGTITIKGGYFEGRLSRSNEGTYNIEGGTFNVKQNKTAGVGCDYTVCDNGTDDPSSCKNIAGMAAMLNPGYIAVPTGEDGVYTVQAGQTVAVTFSTNGKTANTVVYIKNGDTISRPNPDTKYSREEAGEFGWYDGNGAFDFTTPITSNITLYGKWKHTVSFDKNGGVGTIDNQEIRDGGKVNKPANPTKDGEVFAGWFNGDDAFDFGVALRNTDPLAITLTGRWEAMISTGTAKIEQEDGTQTGMVVEANAPATPTVGAAQVQASNSTATIQGEVELDVYNDADGDGNKDGSSSIPTKVNFTSPVLVRIPVNSTENVKVKVKHNGETSFTTDGLSTSSTATCSSGVATPAYTGTPIAPNGGYVEIYTCSASTFVAYTETSNSTSSNGGGGGTTTYSCKNLPDNAVANNTTKPSKNTDYSYSTDTGTVCTFQCKTGYTWNADKKTCDKADETVSTGDDTTDDTNTETLDPKEVLANGFTREFNDAYEFAFANGITTMKTIQEAAMEEGLTRIAMAKMLSQYAINVLKKTPDTSKTCEFGDVTKELDEQYNNGVTLACQLGIMGVGITDFRPFDPVIRAEFGTALSRLLFGIEDGEDAYYTTHLAKLKEAGIISNDDPTLEELRGYVMLMLMRSAK